MIIDFIKGFFGKKKPIVNDKLPVVVINKTPFFNAQAQGSLIALTVSVFNIVNISIMRLSDVDLVVRYWLDGKAKQSPDRKPAGQYIEFSYTVSKETIDSICNPEVTLVKWFNKIKHNLLNDKTLRLDSVFFMQQISTTCPQNEEDIRVCKGDVDYGNGNIEFNFDDFGDRIYRRASTSTETHVKPFYHEEQFFDFSAQVYWTLYTGFGEHLTAAFYAVIDPSVSPSPSYFEMGFYCGIPILTDDIMFS